MYASRTVSQALFLAAQGCHTADFQYNTGRCFLQKFSDDTTVVGLIRGGDEEVYRVAFDNFLQWSVNNHLHLNTTKIKEMVLDFRRGRSRIQPTPITIGGTEVELVTTISTLVCSLTVSWTGRAIWRRCTARGNLFFKEVI